MSKDIEFCPGIKIGDQETFYKTISESDVYMFAGITGDFSPNHVNSEYMAHTRYGERIVHGALLVGFTSTVSAQLAERSTVVAVAIGYDRIRFLKPVYFGDTIRVLYEVSEADPQRQRLTGQVTVTNQGGETCLVGKHLLKFFAASSDGITKEANP